MLRAFRDAFRIPELQRKFLFTLLLLAIYRLGSTIPTPGVDHTRIAEAAGSAGSLLSLISNISGGNLSQFSIFALGVLPYITASIIMQILTTSIPALEKLQKEGEEGRKAIAQYTRYGAIALGAMQALFFAILVGEAQNGAFLASGWEPGWMFRLNVVLTQVAGIAFTLWIGERITEVGIGNGVSLIIFSGIAASFPKAISDIITLYNEEAISLLGIVAFFLVILAVVIGIVLVLQAERRIPIQYARKEIGGKQYAKQQTYLPIKLNGAGVIPVIFASAVMTIVQVLEQAFGQDSEVTRFLVKYFALNTPTGIALDVLLVVGFTFLYNSIQFDPKRIAENLRESGGFIPSVRPGVATAEYLSFISTRITLWGAIFLGILVLVPQVLQATSGISGSTVFVFSGTGLLILVGVALDTLKQVEAQLTLRSYDGFISKGRLRGRL
ncbi:preprotein translocase subunit SecY [Deinococcus misasensis]|uniref:preprotein translocase subunit SecY n=1 Tax=Deinococcus misasensis TaxID=392413 RepID=UPI0005597BC9|nr:preprotein translocase subunit SecY [Deinococcus misasensis]